MITESQIYWITRLDGMKSAVLAMGISLAFVFAVCLTISCVVRFDEEEKKATKFIVLSLVMLVLSILIAFLRVFIPTTKEMCIIKVVPIIVADEGAQEIPDKVVELANDWLDELKPNKKE